MFRRDSSKPGSVFCRIGGERKEPGKNDGFVNRGGLSQATVSQRVFCHFDRREKSLSEVISTYQDFSRSLETTICVMMAQPRCSDAIRYIKISRSSSRSFCERTQRTIRILRCSFFSLRMRSIIQNHYKNAKLPRISHTAERNRSIRQPAACGLKCL